MKRLHLAAFVFLGVFGLQTFLPSLVAADLSDNANQLADRIADKIPAVAAVPMTAPVNGTSIVYPAMSQPTNPIGERLMTREDLDPATLRANALEQLILEKLGLVLKSSGLESSKYQSSASVHVLEKIILPPPPEKKPKKPKDPNADGKKPFRYPAIQSDDPTQSGFLSPESPFSADALVRRYSQELKHDTQEAEEDSEQDTPTPQPKTEYLVDKVYVHVGLAEDVSADVAKKAEETIKNAFNPVFGNHFAYDIQRYPVAHQNLLQKLLPWIERLQSLTLAILAAATLLMAMVLSILLFKRVPHWKASYPEKTAHSNESLEIIKTSELQELDDEQEEEEELEEEKEELPPAPVIPESIGPSQAELDKQLRRKLMKTEKSIVVFVRNHPEAARQTMSEWAKTSETESSLFKINLAVELMAKEQIPLGRLAFRGDVLQDLKNTKKRTLELPVRDKVELLDSIFWDLIAQEHLSTEPHPMPFQFLASASDRALTEALRQETPKNQALVLISLSEKRAAKILNLLKPEERSEVVTHLFSAEDATHALPAQEISRIAGELKSRIDIITQEQEFMGRMGGIEGFLPILRTMDFDAQFSIARTFGTMGEDIRTRIFSNYFNVALLPLAKTEFLAQILLDRPTNFLNAVLAAFDGDFSKKVIDQLPIMQQRMLEGAPPVSKAEQMDALKALNEEILKKLASSELGYERIFPIAPEERGYGNTGVNAA